MIKGKQITLQPATLEDRSMIYEWAHTSDSGRFLLSLSSDPHETFEAWCDDWKEYYFTDEDPELGRLFLIQQDDMHIGAIAYNDIYPDNRVELDIWMSSEANCGKGLGSAAITALCAYLSTEFDVVTFMMQPSVRNPRAVRAYEKAGFVRKPATPEEIEAEWGGVDQHDSVLMIRQIIQQAQAPDAKCPGDERRQTR